MDDTSFDHMTALLKAVWPAVSKIDWSQYCTRGVESYNEAGVPKYTGLLMHRSTEGRIIGASTVAVGFLPRPESSATIVTRKTAIILDSVVNTASSIQRRDPDKKVYGGGVLSSRNDKLAYAISGLPEIGDHLLVAEMMWTCALLSLDDWSDITSFEFAGVEEACDQVGMDNTNFNALKERITALVEEQSRDLGLRN